MRGKKVTADQGESGTGKKATKPKKRRTPEETKKEARREVVKTAFATGSTTTDAERARRDVGRGLGGITRLARRSPGRIPRLSPVHEREGEARWGELCDFVLKGGVVKNGRFLKPS